MEIVRGNLDNISRPASSERSGGRVSRAHRDRARSSTSSFSLVGLSDDPADIRVGQEEPFFVIAISLDCYVPVLILQNNSLQTCSSNVETGMNSSSRKSDRGKYYYNTRIIYHYYILL